MTIARVTTKKPGKNYVHFSDKMTDDSRISTK